ncbi:MAG: BTAD domain-containing putative transcriptional regulator [Armatimonas sp.]
MSPEVRLLGELSVTQKDTVIAHFRTQKTAALLAFLAFHTGTPQPREALIERFWPEADLDQGRMSLRTALSSLRKLLGDSLITDTSTAMVNVRTDLVPFEKAVRAARSDQAPEPERIRRAQEAVEIYRGPLLPGFYEDWVLAERDRLAGAYIASLSMLARWHTDRDELAQALDYAHRAAMADPLHEGVRAELIRLLRKANRPAEALRQYRELERLLDELLGARPKTTTAALVEGLTENSGSSSSEPEAQVHLPHVLGRFRGRRDTLNTLTRRLSGGKSDAEGIRLFTLFGPGGAGKTRLAIEAGRRLAAHGFFVGIYFVPLATAYDEGQFWEGLREGLGLAAAAQFSPSSQIIAYLRASHPTLLLCDNLEQADPEVSLAIEFLLNAVPDLTVLATSRRRLAIPGEELFAVGGLSEDDAIALFVDRARSVSSEFTLTPENEASVRALCGRVEGSPLALELAAAWAGALTPAEMCVQLESSLLKLPERKSGEERHRSLKAAIAWSLDLLEPELRQSFCRLSIFPTGFDSEAAQSVCEIHRHTLAILRDRSLLQTEAHESGMRFSLHESLRAYGKSQLSSTELATLAERHTSYFYTLAQRARAGLRGPEELAWRQRLTREWLHLQAAIEARLEILSDPNGTLDFCRELSDALRMGGREKQGLSWLERALSAEVTMERRLEALLEAAHFTHYFGDQEGSTALLQEAEALAAEVNTPKARAHFLLTYAYLQGLKQGDMSSLTEVLDEAIALYRTLDQKESLVLALSHRGDGQMKQGLDDLAEASLREARQLAEELGWRSRQAQIESDLGLLLCNQGRAEEAEPIFQAALAEFTALGMELEVAHQHMNLGRVAYEREDAAGAQSRLEQAQTLYVKLGDQTHAMFALHNLGLVAEIQGDFEGMRRYQCESLRRAVEYQDRLAIIAGLESLGTNCHTLGDSLQGARLCGAAAQLRQKYALPQQEEQEDVYQQMIETIGEDAFEEAFAQGQALTQTQAVALALSEKQP